MVKVKDKEKILKHKKKNNLFIQEKPHEAISRFFSRNYRKKTVFLVLMEKKTPTKNSLPSKIIIQN